MIQGIVTELGAWSWWILGFILLILEMLVPGVFFLWVGLAAILVGTAALLVPIAWQAQVIAFAVLSLALAIVGRRIYARYSKTSDRPMLNQRARQHIGKTYALEDDLKNGQGRVRIGDTLWIAHGQEDIDAGTLVTVTGADGTVLTVEKA